MTVFLCLGLEMLAQRGVDHSVEQVRQRVGTTILRTQGKGAHWEGKVAWFRKTPLRLLTN